MTICAALLVTAMWLTVMRTPDTPIARAAWRTAVTSPIAWTGRLRRRDVLVTLLIGAMVTAVMVWLGREGGQLLAMAVPDIGTWLVTFEIGTYLDALTAIVIAASAVRVKGFIGRWSAGVVAPLRAVRRGNARLHRPRRPKPPANDDEGQGWAGRPWSRAA